MRRIASREIDRGKQVTKRDKEYERDLSKGKKRLWRRATAIWIKNERQRDWV